jgi:sugar phosphate isomerase/epimerase
MPKISLSTWSFFLKMNSQRAMDFAVRNGFEGIEIWCNTFDFWPRAVTSKEIATVRSAAKDHHLSLAVHFCMTSNNLAELNVGHLNESMNQLKETIRLCRRIGGGMVVVHPGTCPEIVTHNGNHLNPKYTPAALKQAAIEQFRKSLREATLFAQSHDVVIGLENSSHIRNCIHSTISDLMEWVDEINNPSLGITLDIGHAQLEGGVSQVINLLGARIKHVHLYDINGTNDDQRELGTGIIDWPSISAFLRTFPGMLTLEVVVREDLEGAVLRSKAFLDRLLKDK